MSSDNYNLLCDDFYLDMYINTKLDLPAHRDTVLAFFERIQKQFPSMGFFYYSENNEFCLEENRGSGQYRWLTLEANRIGSGIVNPADLEDAYTQDRLVIEVAPYMLSVSHLDIESLDVVFAMDFYYAGNHDEVIAEALLGSSAFSSILDLPNARPIDFSPAVVVALSDDYHTQVRINIESKTSRCGPLEKKHSAEEAVTLSFTVRQYPSGTGKFDALKSFENQHRLAERLMAEKIIPNFVQPLANVIAQKRLI
jgi:hypothetical protein